jgi:hypothetical protein
VSLRATCFFRLFPVSVLAVVELAALSEAEELVPAEALPFIVELVAGVDVAELAPLRDVVLLVGERELGESEDEDDVVVPVLMLTPASELGAEPLTLPPGLDGALYVELLVCEVVSAVGDFLLLFMSSSARAEALPRRMTEEKNTGASLRMRSS